MMTYAMEACDELIHRRLIHDAPVDEPTRDFLMDYPRTTAAAQLIVAKQLYDLVHDGTADKSPRRTEASHLGATVMLFADLVDEQADLPGVSPDHKADYFGAALDAFIKGGTDTYTPQTKAEETVLGLGVQIHDRYIRFDSGGLFSDLFHKLCADAQQQVVSQKLQEQLELSAEIGKSCAGIYISAAELLEGRSFEEYAPAIDGFGALGECLDNAYEISQDVQESSNTYATLLLKQHGDSRSNRQLAKSILAARGMREYQGGRQVLNPQQSSLYSLMGRMLAARYKLARNVRGSIGPKISLSPACEV